jgi:hypothetical protein
MSFNSHSFNSSSFNAKAFTLAHVFAAAVGTYAYAGEDAALLHNKYISAEAGTYAYTGEDAGTTKATFLTAAVGTYTIVGTDADLREPILIDAAEVGGYVYRGKVAATTEAGGSFSFNPSAFNPVSFNPNAFNLGYIAPVTVASVGTYEIVGTNAVTVDVSQLVSISAGTGTYTYAGTDSFLIPGPGKIAVDFTVDFNLLSPKSPFAGKVAFQDIVAGDACAFDAFTTPSGLTVDMSGDGEFTVGFPVPVTQTFDYYFYDASDGTRGTTEQITVLQFSQTDAEVGVYTLSGTDATTPRVLEVAAEVGIYNYNGEAVTIFSDGEVSLNAEVGTYNLLGTDSITLWLGGEVVAEVGTYTWTSTDVIFLKTLILDATVGVYSLLGTDSLLRAPRNYWVKEEPQTGPPTWSKAGARSATWTKQDDFLRGV